MLPFMKEQHIYAILAVVITVAFGALLYQTWDGVSDMRERMARVEVRLDNLEKAVDAVADIVDRIDKRQAAASPSYYAVKSFSDWVEASKALGYAVEQLQPGKITVLESISAESGFWIVGTDPEAAEFIRTQYGPK